MSVLLSVIVSLLASLSVIEADTASLRTKFSNLKIDAVFPGDSSYEKLATPFNKRFTYAPAAIVFPDHVQAVSDSVKVAVGEKLTGMRSC